MLLKEYLLRRILIIAEKFRNYFATKLSKNVPTATINSPQLVKGNYRTVFVSVKDSREV